MTVLTKIYEDEHLLAVSKPQGFLTVSSQKGQKNLLDQVKREYAKQNIKIRPLHRLDRGTSGIVMFAKTKQCYEEAIEKHKFSDTRKTYVALITGVPKFKVSEVTIPLPSRQDKRKVLPAKTKYKVIETMKFYRGSASLVEAEISSGRFHQIRIHFSMIHHPLLMDRDYMDKGDYKHYRNLLPFMHFFLHAQKISFKHFVTGEPMEIKDKLPKEFQRAISTLRS